MVKNGQGAFLGIFMQTAFLTLRLKEMDFRLTPSGLAVSATMQFKKKFLEKCPEIARYPLTICMFLSLLIEVSLNFLSENSQSSNV